jgi:hypothetical protein
VSFQLFWWGLCIGAGVGLGCGFVWGHNTAHREVSEHVCQQVAGKSARYIEGRCYVASPDGSLVPAKGAK